MRGRWDAVQLTHGMYLSLLLSEDGEREEEWIEKIQEIYDGIEALVEDYRDKESKKALQQQQKNEQVLALRLRAQEIMLLCTNVYCYSEQDD